MFGLDVIVDSRMQRVEELAERAQFRNFGHASARISKDAKASIVTSSDPSPPGSPPHTRAQRGHNLRGAIRYASDQDGAIIGPMKSIVGDVGQAHEFGGRFRGEDFERRPFMGPALERNLDRFADDWEGSIGE